MQSESTDDSNILQPSDLVPAAPQTREQILRDAVIWALGGYGNFPERPSGEGRYWWRSELCQRAGLRWDGANYLDEPGAE